MVLALLEGLGQKQLQIQNLEVDALQPHRMVLHTQALLAKVGVLQQKLVTLPKEGLSITTQDLLGTTKHLWMVEVLLVDVQVAHQVSTTMVITT
jgi:hypothetical protein